MSSFHRLFLTLSLGLSAVPLHAADWTFTYEDTARAVAHGIGDDGSTYLVGNAPADTHFVTRLAPDGSVAWRREFPGQWTRRPSTMLELAGDRLCLYGGDTQDENPTQAQYIACYRVANGDLLTRFQFDRLTVSGPHNAQSFTMGLADGGFVNLTARHSGADASGNPLRTVRHRRFTSAGALQHDIVLGDRGFAEVDGRRADGAILFQTGLRAREYTLVDANGTALFSLPDVDLVGTNAQFAPDGSIHLAGWRGAGSDGYERRQYAPTGQELARVPLDSCATCFAPVDFFFGQFTFDRSQTFLTTRYHMTDEFGFRVSNFVARLSAPEFELPTEGIVRVDPRTNAPVVLSPFQHKVGIRTLDATTAATLESRFLATCAQCFVDAVHVADDGSLRIVASSGGDIATDRLTVFALDNAFAPRPRTRVDQTGLRGAWYATYAPGQGFVVDYVQTSSTLFIPWFTYAANGGATDGLRWYSLQGQLASGATRATLDIFENTGGMFASPPETTPRRVGTATLEAHDCDSATLTYALDTDTTRTISLTRLTPATEPCVLADGSTRGSRPAASNGFDARQSGSWFVPGRAGQGTLFTVQPGGLFFGAWFTYDVGPDDPTAQHWFSMQGDLAGATNGSVTLPLYRTTGGARDDAAATTTVQVGTATVRFTACDRATLDYEFDAEAADAFRGQIGTLALEKLGGCTP